jgi:low temperature requirement protein LtrA
LHIPVFIILALVELLIPVWAERAVPTPWHAHHVRERYGLFTILVLGESILSTSIAIQSASDGGPMSGDLLSVIIGGLLIVYAMWWLYFYQPARPLLMTSLRAAFAWGYGHLIIFGATAAVGAGLAVVVDQVTHHAEISATGAGLAVALPTAIYVLSLWLLHERPLAKNAVDTLLHPVTAVLILLAPFTGQAVLATGILLVILVAIRLVRHLE